MTVEVLCRKHGWQATVGLPLKCPVCNPGGGTCGQGGYGYCQFHCPSGSKGEAKPAVCPRHGAVGEFDFDPMQPCERYPSCTRETSSSATAAKTHDQECHGACGGNCDKGEP